MIMSPNKSTFLGKPCASLLSFFFFWLQSGSTPAPSAARKCFMLQLFSSVIDSDGGSSPLDTEDIRTQACNPNLRRGWVRRGPRCIVGHKGHFKFKEKVLSLSRTLMSFLRTECTVDFTGRLLLAHAKENYSSFIKSHLEPLLGLFFSLLDKITPEKQKNQDPRSLCDFIKGVNK